MAVLTLGGVQFENWELPEEIKLGGHHCLKIHKLPGGTRIVDSMGPDDAPITWSGKFRGSSALLRATGLDALRRGGKPQSLMVLGLSYTVKIECFDFNPRRAGLEIPYSISCEVVQNNANGASSALSSLGALISGDIAGGLAQFG